MELVTKIQEEAILKIEQSQTSGDLESAYIDIFGKKGLFTQLAGSIREIEVSQRAAFGQALNAVKRELENRLEEKKKQLRTAKTEEVIDITAPGKKHELGHLHLVSQAIEEIVSIFNKLGFALQSYPEIDWDYYAFEALNMPKNHPARDDWETFFINAPQDPKMGKQVLTPHTSNGQVREMQSTKPPIRMLNISRCYRRQIDVSHTPMFHQFEGLLIDENVTISQLKGTFDYFTTQFFGKSRVTRLRPHHFRFTEPSFEVDVTCGICMGRGCRFCKAGWVELGGSGMVHPNVLKAGNIDANKYSGFAFGWGIERTIAMKTDIPDIRLLYQNDLRFLEQF